MDIEYEAMFPNIDKDKTRALLKEAGAKLVRPEFIQRRVTLDLPNEENSNRWLRVRDEGDKNTLSLKDVTPGKIEGQKELMVKVSDFDTTVKILEEIGAYKKSYQESKRELWDFDGVEVTIDEWPFLEPFVEVEGKDEVSVRAVSEKLGFNWGDAIFASITELYARKYGISYEVINTKIPRIVFGEPNPFINK